MDLLTLINRAGRQRMLTQELMKLHLIKSYNIPYRGHVNQDILECVESFNSTQVMLGAKPDNNLRVQKAISVVNEAWMKFIAAFETHELDDVVELNTVVLKEMDHLVTELVLQYSKSCKA
ncbi:hypothetical protein [Lentisphaera araneosa]|jgi:hypothetical protein|nr:hypothetical protein [Lentisphaera araneosa]